MIRLLTTFLKPYRGALTLVVGLQLVANVAALYLPNLNGTIIDDGIAKGNVGLIWGLGGLMLVVTVAQMAAQITAVYFGSRAAMGFGRDVRAAVFDQTLSFSARFSSSIACRRTLRTETRASSA